MNIFPYLPVPSRPNITNSFKLVDALRLFLQNSPLSLKSFVWVEPLNIYPDSLQIHLPMIFRFRALLGYRSSKTFILSKNLASVLVDTELINKKLADDLRICRVEEVTMPTSPFISFSFGLIPKYDESWKKTHHSFHSIDHLVDNHILDNIGEMRYTQFQDILQMVLRARKNCVILK